MNFMISNDGTQSYPCYDDRPPTASDANVYGNVFVCIETPIGYTLRLVPWQKAAEGYENGTIVLWATPRNGGVF